ncbi:hypothetical protein K3G63_11295 [Hymenobacter sp. HSC-4F20]|uniref:hypothetical protein n=1 Tax=Hymenobacter sp. HSC-4F20 TaxID=2864135 RepID=UPI001C73DE75|nr:hypothetical protein [Hymenobacter sp. HSC-4F20]MBX0291029.1 hypothetical protein [Hymenobacter sp. HSC-4F20]
MVAFAAGPPGERQVVQCTVCYSLARALSTGAVTRLRHADHTCWPDNLPDCSCFPSAHRMEAFLTATLLHEQFR